MTTETDVYSESCCQRSNFICNTIPILIGVHMLTFTLFFVVNSPDDMAVSQLGEKYVTPEAIAAWKKKNGYDKPLFFNAEAEGASTYTDTIFFTKSLKLFAFDFGRSESGRDITTDVSTRMWPSLAVALPTFAVGIWVNICVALMGVMFHGTPMDRRVAARSRRQPDHSTGRAPTRRCTLAQRRHRPTGSLLIPRC